MSRSGILVGAFLFGVALACEGASRPSYSAALPTAEPEAGRPPDPRAPWPSRDACVEAVRVPPVIRDFDGDGVLGGWVMGCGAPSQWGTLFSNDDDCDDTDPTRAAKGFRDADGDGVTVGSAECFSTRPAGYLPLWTGNDCDDSSADRQAIGWRDSDGDGYGSPDGMACVKAPGIDGKFAAGFSGSYSDCNDGDPSINPLAAEHWNDGVDSNCDGSDSPLRCDTNRKCGCELVRGSSVAVIPSCPSADLFFVDQMTCKEACTGYSVLVVGNQGASPVVGTVDLVAPDGTRFPVDGNLGPGAVSFPVVVKNYVPSVRIDTTAAQCDTTNDERTLEISYVRCAL